MKKLMIAAAIVCAAAFAQAATVTWSSAKMFTAKDSDGGFSSTAIGSKATAELFMLTKSQYETFLEAYGKSGDMSAVWNAYDAGDLGTAAKSGKTTGMGSAVSLTTSASANETVYGAIIYTYTDENYGDMYIANIATATVGSEGLDMGINNLGTKFLGDDAGTATGGWNAVPEPTSGLLLLLGVAGLALRRRRA